MPTEELKFEDLLKEYIEVIESTDVNKLKEENKVIKVDIERKGKEEKDIDARIEQIQSELDSLNENSTVKLEYPEAIKDKEDKLKEANDFKENKEKEIKELKDKTKENNKKIRRVNNIGKDVIKRAEEKTNKENEELQKKIEELKARKDKYGIKRKDKDGKETIQLTKEEQIVVDSIDNDIKKLNKEIKDNRKAFLLFKKTIEETKKDKEAFLALKNKVKGKEEPKKEEPKEKPEQEKNNEQKTENAKEEPKKDDIAHEEIPVTPTGKTSEKTVNNNNPTSRQTGKTEKKKDEEKPIQNPTEKTGEKEENSDKPSREGKVEYTGKEVPGVQQPEYEIHEVKDPEDDKDIYSNSYEKELQEYKEMLEVYNEHVVDYADFDYTKYENGEISYSEYEKHALGLAQEYQVMKKAYENIKARYDKENKKEDVLSNEDLENRLKELDEETTELWQQGVHENTPDAKRYHEALAEIRKIKEELKQRQENPLRGMSLEELEAKKNELYAKIAEQQEPDEYQFRTYEENGLEGYEDEIDKGLREIREEIERRQPKLEAPEEPVNPGMVMEKGKGQVPPSQTNNLPIKETGLQIMASLFKDEDMPEIKAKHMLSGNPIINSGIGFTPWLVAATVTTPALLPGLGLIAGGAITSAALKPVIAKITGRKKITDQVSKVVDKLSDERLEILADWLTEEKIVELMPNEIFLDGLQKVLEKRGIEVKNSNDIKLAKNDIRRREINNEYVDLKQELNSKEITEERKKEIEEKLDKLDKEAGELSQEREKLKSNTDKKLTHIKQVVRGKERKGHGFRGNVRGAFDGLFELKNMPSKEYVPILLEHAKIEKEKLEVEAAKEAGIGKHSNLEKIGLETQLDDHLKENSKGIGKKSRRKAFNAAVQEVKIVENEQEITTTAIENGKNIKDTDNLTLSSGRMISDREDHRVRNTVRFINVAIGTIGTIVNSIKQFKVSQKNYEAAEKNASELDKIKDGYDKVEQTNGQEITDAEIAKKAAGDEYGTLQKSGSKFGETYNNNHNNMTKGLEEMQKDFTGKGNSPADSYDNLSNITKKADTFDLLSKDAVNGNMDGFNQDHTVMKEIFKNSDKAMGKQSEFFAATADLLRTIKTSVAEHGVKPILNIFPSLLTMAAVHSDDRLENKKNKDRQIKTNNNTTNKTNETKEEER